jgi:hypothetical protein
MLQRLTLGNRIRLSVPADVSPSAEPSIDSGASLWRGEGVTVIFDEGPFSDPLTSYSNRPNYRMTDEVIGGRRARVVSFEPEDGGHYVAAHFLDESESGGLVTVAVQTAKGVPPAVGAAIVQSVAFL